MVCASDRKSKGAVIDLQESLGPQMGPDLGSGGFGRVTLHMFNGRPVAVKQVCACQLALLTLRLL